MCKFPSSQLGVACGLAIWLIHCDYCLAQADPSRLRIGLLHLNPPTSQAQPLSESVVSEPVPPLEQRQEIPVVPQQLDRPLPTVPSESANEPPLPLSFEAQPATHPRRSGLLELNPPPPASAATSQNEGSTGGPEETSHENQPAQPRHWWESTTMEPLRPGCGTLAININSLVYDALKNSARVQSVSEYVAISEAEVLTALASFDPKLFAETKYNRLSVPTGSSLDAGFNILRLREHNWYYSTGFRRRNQLGGNWELSQRIGTKDSNSQFFTPDNQGNSRLSLSYTQPLLNGSGKVYNQSLIVLATIDTRIAADRTAAELQDYLLNVTEAYWEIYRQRSAMLQKKLNFERATLILNYLRQRRDIDSTESQVAVVQSAVSLRSAELVQAETLIRNAESRLRALVNSPTLVCNRDAELVPVELPNVAQQLVPDLCSSLVTAINRRPEVDRSMREIESARVRSNMARNELQPVLDFVLESYVSGLRGDLDIGRSWIDQFATGEPTMTAGFVYELPIRQRAGRAQQQKRLAELRQLTAEFRDLTQSIHADVEVAVREVDTAFRLLHAKRDALEAAGMNAQSLHRRWETLPGDDRAASLLLQDLLDAQDRVLTQEVSLVQAQTAYVISLTRYKRATGQLLDLACSQ